MTKFNLTTADIKIYFDHKTYQHGKDYFVAKKVKKASFEKDGKDVAIIGTVQGSYDNLYQTKVIINNFGEIQTTHCDCPVTYDCKHAAALCFDALALSGLSEQQYTSPNLLTNEQMEPVKSPSRAPARKLAISPEIQNWLQQLEALVNKPADLYAYPEKVCERLLYVLKKPQWDYQRSKGIEVHFYLAYQAKAGEYTSIKSLTAGMTTTTARYIIPVDQEILAALELEKRRINAGITDNPYLSGANGASLLTRMMSTKRCFWDDPHSQALISGKARPGKLVWQLDDNGEQVAHCILQQENAVILPFSPPYYIDPDTRETGTVITEIDSAIVEKLLTAPPIKPQEAQLVKNKLNIVLPAQLPQLTVLNEKRIEHIKPQVCLRLYAKHDSRYPQAPLIPYADLSFDYHGKEVFLSDQKELTQVRQQTLATIVRNKKIEIAASETLSNCGLKPIHILQRGVGPHVFGFDAYQDSPEWIAFTLEKLPQLEAKGWKVRFDTSYPHRFVTSDDSEWYSELEEKSNNQWFDLELGILVAGERINLLPVLIKAIATLPHQFTAHAIANLKPNNNVIVPLEDGRKLLLPMQRIQPILQVLTELFDSNVQLTNGKLNLSILRSAQLEDLMLAAGNAANFRWLGGQRLLALGKKLQQFTGIKSVEPPAEFKTELRPYQREGLNWLQFLCEYDLAGILADDMGLGKTVQALAHIALEKQAGRLTKPALVIAPTSLMYNWRTEAEKFTPHLRVLTLHGVERKTNFSTMEQYDLILTTYPLLVRDEKILIEQEYHLLILDEAQIIKNSKAKATQIVHFLKTRHRLCLTGTPMENHLGELWSLFHFLLPGLLGDKKQFAKLFRIPIEQQNDKERRAALAKRVAPFLLRRTKQDVLKELPEKVEIIRNVEIIGDQRDLYESVRLAMNEKVSAAIRDKGLSRSHIVILDALLKLRQICCDPRLLKMESAKKSIAESAKLQLLIKLVNTLLEEGRHILLFSQFTEMLELIEEELAKYSIQYVKLTGKTQDRETPIRQFQNGEVKLFLISLKAGGVGLNLTAADAVIHYDPWWNPAVEQQATDRAHRIGQTKTVFVYKLLTVNTVEEKILQMQNRKRTLLEGLFSEQVTEKSSLIAEDLTELFNNC